MDGTRRKLYFSLMAEFQRGGPPPATVAIPAFFLYGETLRTPDERTIHIETIAARSRLHEWTIRPHRHRDLHQILFIQRGRVTASLDERSCSLRAPGLILVPPTSVHAFRFQESTVGV